MSPTQPRDFFDRARLVAVVALIGAGALAIVGALLDWVTIAPPRVVPDAQADALATFTGLETSDGRIILAGGALLIVCGLLLGIRKRAGWAWAAFLVSIVIGAVGIADYRDITTVFYDEMNRIGKPSPALGLLLDAAAGIVGLVGSLAGIAATPRRDPE